MAGKEKRELIYIIENERGQETLSFDEFKERFRWEIKAEKARLAKSP